MLPSLQFRPRAQALRRAAWGLAGALLLVGGLAWGLRHASVSHQVAAGLTFLFVAYALCIQEIKYNETVLGRRCRRTRDLIRIILGSSVRAVCRKSTMRWPSALTRGTTSPYCSRTSPK